MPHLLSHRASVYNGHLQGPVTLAPIPSVWQWSHYKFFSRLGIDRTLISHMRGERIAAVQSTVKDVLFNGLRREDGRWKALILKLFTSLSIRKNNYHIALRYRMYLLSI